MKIMTRVLLGLGVLVLLATGGAALFVATFDPNEHKATLAAKVKAATGRDLSIDGAIEWAVWPKLRLKLGPVALSNAAGFGDEPLIAIKELEVAVATWPLLSRRIEMDTVRIVGAAVDLAKDADGRTNWADLVPESASPADKDRGESRIAALILGGIDVRDAELTWRDASGGRDINVSALNVQSGPLTFGAPVALTLSADVRATKPQIDGAVKIASTLTYDTDAERYAIKPLTFDTTLRGKTLPGGSAEIKGQAAIDLDLAAGIATISDLTFDGLGNSARGELTVDHLQARPGARGKFNLAGKDLATVLKAFALPAANQVATLKDRSFEFNTEFDANMDTGNLVVPTLTARFLGANVTAELNGSKIDSDTPALKGKLGATGADLPALLAVLSQFRGGDSKAGQGIAQALGQVKDRAFKLNAEFDADLAAGRIDLPNLTASILGNEIQGTITSSSGSAGKPALKGELTAKGPDLAAIVLATAAVQGLNAQSIAALNTVLGKRPDKSFSVKSSLAADLARDEIELPALTASLFGNQLKGALRVTRAASGKPALTGALDADGPDLPALLAIAGGFQGSDSGLVGFAASLARATNKAFTFKTKFDADLQNGRAEISTLSAQSLGLNLEGTLKADALDRPTGGAIDGRITLKGSDLKALLQALDQPDLATSIQAIAFDAGIKGNSQNLTLSPLTATVQIAGSSGSKAVELRLGVGTAVANLAQETMSLRDLTLTGLGINLKGALEATKIKTAPAYTGQLSVPTFNLRNLLASLNTPITTMSDPKALGAVGLTTAIKGTSTGAAFNGLVLTLDETTLKGDIALKAFAGPDLEFALSADALDADRYLAPKDKGNAKPVTPEAAAVGASTLPVETLREIKVKGDLKIAQLQISGAKLTNLALTLVGRNGKIALNPVTADLYQGRYQGAVTVDATGKQPQLVLKTTLAKVEVEPLLVDLSGKSDLSGTVNFEANLNAVGGDADRIKRTLSGPASFAVQNGVFRGLDIPAILKAAELVIESKGLPAIPKGGSTQFQALTGSLDINEGVVKNQDLLLDGLGFKVTGEGMLANLNDMTIKYDSRLAIDEGAVEKGADHYNLGGYAIPIRCRGEISGTSCLPDFAELGKKAAIKVVKDKIKEKVGGTLGGAGKALEKLLKF